MKTAFKYDILIPSNKCLRALFFVKGEKLMALKDLFKRPNAPPEDESGALTPAEAGMLDEERFVSRAYALFEEFRQAHRPYWLAAEENELFYESRGWEAIGADPRDPTPTMPVVQSMVDHLKAERMEGYPEAIVLPQRMADKEIARQATEAVKYALEAGRHREHYLKQLHDSLVCGWSVTETGWDGEMHYGLGEAYIRRVDPRCFMCDPCCESLQDGRACFKFTARSREWMKQHYPKQYPSMTADAERYASERPGLRAQDEDELLLIEYWYREYDGERYSVHMALMAGGVLVEDSREVKPEGYFAHGQYPFVLNPLYPIAGSPLGFSMVDVLKNPQMYSDKLEQIIMRNSLTSSKLRMLVNRTAEFDEEALLDLRNDVVRGSRIDEGAVRWFQTAALPAYVTQLPQLYRKNMKDYSGVSDIQRGETSRGVTAASAIMALQDAASKRSKLAEEADHTAFSKAVALMLEVVREFYSEKRLFMSVERGEEIAFSARSLVRDGVPVELSVSTKVQRASVYSSAYYNELALELLKLGVLAPPEAVDMMTFEGKENVKKAIAIRSGNGVV